MSNTAKMNPTAYDWHQNDSVQKLRDMIIISAQQIESVLHTDFPIETVLLCSDFVKFYQENFKEGCKIKPTSTFSNKSLVFQKEIEKHYKEVFLLVNLYISKVKTHFADIVNELRAAKEPQEI